MKYYFLASGSSGNATALVNDNNEILLIDCGIALTDIKSRLNQVGLDFSDVKKVLDQEGLKYLWSKISMEDYPNNSTLMAVIDAIDEILGTELRTMI